MMAMAVSTGLRPAVPVVPMVVVIGVVVVGPHDRRRLLGDGCRGRRAGWR